MADKALSVVGHIENVKRLARQERACTRGRLGWIMKFFIAVQAVLRLDKCVIKGEESQQAYKIPIGSPHLKATIPSLMDVTVSVTDDVPERVTSCPDSRSSPAIPFHGIGLTEVVP
jgi:hypothetical protein